MTPTKELLEFCTNVFTGFLWFIIFLVIFFDEFIFSEKRSEKLWYSSKYFMVPWSFY